MPEQTFTQVPGIGKRPELKLRDHRSVGTTTVSLAGSCQYADNSSPEDPQACSQRRAQAALEDLLGMFRLRTARLPMWRDDRETWQSLGTLAVSIAADMRAATGQQASPIWLKPILDMRGGRLVVVPYREEGTLVPCESGFEVRVQAGTALTRVRATVAHELGHTLFYDPASKPCRRILARTQIHAQREEILCWDFARELLLPREMFVSEAKPVPSPDEVLRVAQKFRVSTHLVCRRAFYDTRIWQNAVVSLSGPGSSGPSQNRLYIGGMFRKAFGRKGMDLLRRLGLCPDSRAFCAEGAMSSVRRQWQAELGGKRVLVQTTHIGASKAWTLAVFAPC
jgi:hypothetical protein